jgi:hypothetical protein
MKRRDFLKNTGLSAGLVGVGLTTSSATLAKDTVSTKVHTMMTGTATNLIYEIRQTLGIVKAEGWMPTQISMDDFTRTKVVLCWFNKEHIHLYNVQSSPTTSDCKFNVDGHFLDLKVDPSITSHYFYVFR